LATKEGLPIIWSEGITLKLKMKKGKILIQTSLLFKTIITEGAFVTLCYMEKYINMDEITTEEELEMGKWVTRNEIE